MAGDRAEAEPGGDDGQDLERALAVELLAVGGGDAEHHADLVQRQHGEVGAGDEDGDAEDAVLAREVLEICSMTAWRSTGTRAARWCDRLAGAAGDPLGDRLEREAARPGATAITSVSRTYGTLGGSPSGAPKSTQTTSTPFRAASSKAFSSSSLGVAPSTA